MKKALLFFLISGFAFAQDVTYSLEEMFTKIVDSKTLSPSGKVFLMGYFDNAWQCYTVTVTLLACSPLGPCSTVNSTC